VDTRTPGDSREPADRAAILGAIDLL